MNVPFEGLDCRDHLVIGVDSSDHIDGWLLSLDANGGELHSGDVKICHLLELQSVQVQDFALVAQLELRSHSS